MDLLRVHQYLGSTNFRYCKILLFGIIKAKLCYQQETDMKQFIKLFLTILLGLSTALFISACGSEEPVCHIASDIDLIIPNQTTKKEITSFLGPPAKIRKVADDEEEWLYFQSYDSFMRKVPLIGEEVGKCQFDVAIIHFRGDLVTSSQYRDLTEDEFEQLGVPKSDDK